MAALHPPLQGEGKIGLFAAEGGPGWGDAPRQVGASQAHAAPLSPPPGPLTRADLPPPGGGDPRLFSPPSFPPAGADGRAPTPAPIDSPTARHRQAATTPCRRAPRRQA